MVRLYLYESNMVMMKYTIHNDLQPMLMRPVIVTEWHPYLVKQPPCQMDKLFSIHVEHQALSCCHHDRLACVVMDIQPVVHHQWKMASKCTMDDEKY
jgi:hypothetical protein